MPIKIYQIIKSKLQFSLDDNLGMSTLILIMMILAMSSFLLQSLSTSLFSWQKSAYFLVKYYEQYNRAYSAINWATRQTWQQAHDDWQCQIEDKLELKACIKLVQSHPEALLLVKGEADKVMLYHFGYYRQNSVQPIIEAQHIFLHKGLWIDYNPEKNHKITHIGKQ